MKKLIITTALFLTTLSTIYAQGNFNPSAAFLGMDVKGLSIDLKNQVQNIMQIELKRVNRYELMDSYDLNYLAESKSIKVDNCYGKICLMEVGKALGVQKVISGSVQNLGDNLIIVIKVYDVKEEKEEFAKVSEFLNLPAHIRPMLQISVNSLFGISNDASVVSKLTRKEDYDNTFNNPEQLQLKSDGPRMGLTFFTGVPAQVIVAKEKDGGYAGYPFMFQFGYQFEKMYLNEGNFQALFEFIPMVTGLDQGLFMPSLTVLNGLRNNKNGLEFAFGPTLSVTRKTYGYYNDEKEWVRVGNNRPLNMDDENIEFRMDRRGFPAFAPGFLIAAGKTFKSGKLNIPVNAFVIPAKNSIRFGISMGFNSKSRNQVDF
jgi:hypothetical protein